ncbi:MAG: glycosyltransferase [Gemmatimonas sp.]|nr:glycosyltransferase [Gemmatimonas sp.]
MTTESQPQPRSSVGIEAVPKPRADPTVAGADVLAVIVSYNPDDSIVANAVAIGSQVVSVLVVDNGSSVGADPHLARIAELDNVRVIRCGENLGIAAALNVGLREATAGGWRWLATFDQDSTPSNGFIAALLRAREMFQAPSRAAVVAPIYIDAATGELTSFRRPGSGSGEVAIIESTLTSGSLVDVEICGQLGGFRSDLFIDYVDFEFCFRAADAGFFVIEAAEARLYHNLGRTVRRRLLGRSVHVTNHSADRRYYIARNRLTLYRKYGRARPGWVGRDVSHFWREMVKILLFEEDRGRKMTATIEGVWDGVRGRSGRRR